MTTRKSVKKQEELKQQLARLDEERRREQERKIKQQKLKEMAAKSQPLLQYGLLDAYEFFLIQLANAGIPQGSVYQFAAQSMLKFQKNKLKKKQKLKQVQKINEEAVKIVSEAIPARSKSRVQKQIKPQLLPFKGELTPSDLSLLQQKQLPNK